jgi:hypothetical protein
MNKRIIGLIVLGGFLVGQGVEAASRKRGRIEGHVPSATGAVRRAVARVAREAFEPRHVASCSENRYVI